MLELVENLQRRTTTDLVFEKLHEEIATLAILPGAKLSEADIAQRFGVSRQPVRDAFNRLENLDLLLIRPQRATEVRGFSLERVAHARFIRIRPSGATPYPTALAIRDTQAVMERTVWLAGAESTRTSAARARAYCAPMANTVPTRARRRIVSDVCPAHSHSPRGSHTDRNCSCIRGSFGIFKDVTGSVVCLPIYISVMTSAVAVFMMCVSTIILFRKYGCASGVLKRRDANNCPEAATTWA